MLLIRERTILMLERGEIIEILSRMISEKRYQHSLGVEETAIVLAQRFGANVYKASIAGLVHDCAKNISRVERETLLEKYHIVPDEVSKQEPELLHGVLGAALARDIFNINDEEILSAIVYHTTGKAYMNTLEKIIYLADLIESGRDYPGVHEIREKALTNLDDALLLSLRNVMIYVLQKKCILHPRTVQAWNSLLLPNLHI